MLEELRYDPLAALEIPGREVVCSTGRSTSDARLKINRAIANRYAQLAASFMWTVHIATTRCWLRFVKAA